LFDAKSGVWYSEISKAEIGSFLFAKEGRGDASLEEFGG